MFNRMREPGIVPRVPIVIDEPSGSASIACPTCSKMSWGRDVIVLRGYLNECFKDTIMAYKMPTCGCLIDALRFRLNTVRPEVTFHWLETPSRGEEE